MFPAKYIGMFLPISKFATSSGLHASEILLLVFGLLLVIGLLGELAKSPKWKAHLRKFEVMVIVGVAGELIADGGIFIFSERLQAISDAEVAVLAKEAAETRKRSAELEKETVLLRSKLRTQESRANLLMQPNSQELVAKLGLFRGQKIDIGQCGRQDNEVTLAVMTLMMLLRSVDWKVNLWNPFFPCTTGMQMVIRNNAPESTRAAAAALGEVLNDIGLTLNAPRPGFTVTPKAHAPDTVFPNPSSKDAVLLIVQLHP